jgi:hypothetical protein
MRQTIWVTFGVTVGNHSSIRVHTEDPKTAGTYAVQVEYREGESWADISGRAITMAKVRRESEPSVSAPSSSSTRSVQLRLVPQQSAPPPEPVFEPSDIEPFVDEMLSRILAIAEGGVRLELVGSGTASTDCCSVINFNPEPFLSGHIEAGFGRGLHEAGHIRYDRNGTRKDNQRKTNDPPIGTVLLTRAQDEGGDMLANILNLIMDRRADDKQAKEFPGNENPIYGRLGHLLPGERKDTKTGEVIKSLNGTSLECETSVFIDFVYAIKKRTRPRHAIVCRCVNIALRAIRRVNAHKCRYERLLTASKRILQILRDNATEEDKKREQETSESEQRFTQFMQALQKAISGSRPDSKLVKLFRQMIANKLAVRRRKSLAILPSQLVQVSKKAGSGTGKFANAGAGAGKVLPVVKVPPNPVAYRPILSRVRPQVRGLSDIIQRLSIPEVRQLTGLTRGEFDVEALSVLATGRSDCMQIELREQRLDVGIAFLFDRSSSMSVLSAATGLSVALNEAILPHRRSVESAFFAFHDQVFDCGFAQPNNGIAGVECAGGTQEELGIRVAGNWLRGIRRPRKLLITICDGAPASVAAVKKETDALLAHGILPMRILVGVDIAPRTYPIELFFDSWAELNRELVKVFTAVVLAARTA